jgi:hypothetical protein
MNSNKVIAKANQEIQCDLIPSTYEENSDKSSKLSVNLPLKMITKLSSPENRVVNQYSKETSIKNQSSIMMRIENEKSEIDIDYYLLGSHQNSKQEESVNSYQKYAEEGKCHSNIEVDPFNNNDSCKRKSDGLQPKIVSNQNLHPLIARSNTCEQNKIEPDHKESDKSNLAPNKSKIEKTVTGISQLSAWSRFISPALKKGVKTFRSSKNEDSEILENLPSAMYSQLSNEKQIMEEIKELLTRENVESNRFDKHKWSMPNNNEWDFAHVSFKDEHKFIKIQDHSNILDKLKKPRKTAPIYGDLIKWTKGPRLGFGIFGDVVKAINRQNGWIMAVKRLSIQKSEDEYNNGAIDALKAEINVLRRIEHDNIIRYIGSEIIDKDFWIYIEYASEGSLLNLQQDFGPFDENLIKRFTKEILEGLNFLHSNSIAHQDLKWANVLVCSQGEVKISDFGWARIIEKSMSCQDLYQSLKGTIPWMAPEILRQKHSDWRSDIWSLGCTIIEMATCENPWGRQNIGNNIEDLFKLWDRFGHPDIPDYFSDPLRNFVIQWFTFDYLMRPTASDLLSHEFIISN